MTRQDDDQRTPGEIYSAPVVLERYDPSHGLLPVETELFERWVAKDSQVLDLGVGAGRTTTWLAQRAGRYVALDVVPEMVDACRTNFPDLDIELGDATDLSRFDDNSFDVVVFSFNGIDHLSDDARASCLCECHRVLGRGGILILSRHHSRNLVVEPRSLRGVGWKLALARLVRAGRSTLVFAARRSVRRSFWRGTGYVWDTHHGGMLLAVTTPARAASELRTAGFSLVAGPLAPDHPRSFRSWRSPWFYIAGRSE